MLILMGYFVVVVLSTSSNFFVENSIKNQLSASVFTDWYDIFMLISRASAEVRTLQINSGPLAHKRKTRTGLIPPELSMTPEEYYSPSPFLLTSGFLKEALTFICHRFTYFCLSNYLYFQCFSHLNIAMLC